MNKVKVALTLLTIAITVGPFAYVLIAYRDNPLGLILPPQLSSLGGQSTSGENPGQIGINQTGTGQIGTSQTGSTNQSAPSQSLLSNLLDELNVNQSNIHVPEVVGNPQYNPNTGAFSLEINATNPLTTPISIEQLSAQIESKNNGNLLGNISIPQSIDLQPGQSGIINISGIVSQELVNQIVGQISGNSTENININDIVLKNLDITVAGIKLHFDKIDPSDFQSTLGGLFPGGP